MFIKKVELQRGKERQRFRDPLCAGSLLKSPHQHQLDLSEAGNLEFQCCNVYLDESGRLWSGEEPLDMLVWNPDPAT